MKQTAQLDLNLIFCYVIQQRIVFASFQIIFRFWDHTVFNFPINNPIQK